MLIKKGAQLVTQCKFIVIPSINVSQGIKFIFLQIKINLRQHRRCLLKIIMLKLVEKSKKILNLLFYYAIQQSIQIIKVALIVHKINISMFKQKNANHVEVFLILQLSVANSVLQIKDMMQKNKNVN